jgi:hypothetical protein
MATVTTSEPARALADLMTLVRAAIAGRRPEARLRQHEHSLSGLMADSGPRAG